MKFCVILLLHMSDKIILNLEYVIYYIKNQWFEIINFLLLVLLYLE